MIQENLMQRTLHISDSRSTATAFLKLINGKTYLITAKHVVEHLKNGEKLFILHNGKWEHFIINGLKLLQEDIAYMDSPVSLIGDVIANEVPTVVLGCDLYFLGFPFGMYGPQQEFFEYLPAPFIKRATLSTIIKTENSLVYILDGMNNEGFSGGPVIVRNGENYHIIGIISGYRFQKLNIYSNNTATDQYVHANTGIIFAPSIKEVYDNIGTK
jgi:hypothetical protein